MVFLEIMFHILYIKDFYSHSNWVELGNNAPYSALITADQPLENLAGRILFSGCRVMVSTAIVVHKTDV